MEKSLIFKFLEIPAAVLEGDERHSWRHSHNVGFCFQCCDMIDFEMTGILSVAFRVEASLSSKKPAPDR